MNPLRRFSDPLREMRWTQVVIELLLLVLGILIALAVDDWMQGRRDARMEREYLQLLARDLQRDDEILKEFIYFEERQTSDGIMAYRALRTSVADADYEESDRRTAIVDRNNQFFVDQLYAAHLLNTGLIAPRPTNNLPTINAAMGEFAARIAMPVAAGSDPLWRLSARAPEFEVLVGKVWQRTSVSFQAINNVKVIVEQSAESRAAIAAELTGRRWPD